MQLSSRLLATLFFLLGPALAQGEEPAAPEPAPAPVRRDLRVRLDLGGTEPSTSKQAFEGVVAYRGIQPWEFQGGYTYSDQVFYTSNRGYLTAYRFYDDGQSYLKADATLRKYDYPVDPTIQAPNPDSNSYKWVPRGELEVSHRLSEMFRAGLQYQLFPANFFWDTSSWAVNHKLSGSVEVRPVPQVTLAGRAAVLRDPDPNATTIIGRKLPTPPATANCSLPPIDPQCFATQTSVKYRTTSLIGGSAAVDLERVGAKVEYLPNRDLDNSYDWSILSMLEVRLTNRFAIRLEEVHDVYSSVSNFSGRTAEIMMGAAHYQVSEAFGVRGGYRYVDAPTRTGGTIIVGVELRPGF
jgi:hypothetical protein